ncbi:phenylacetyl- ligase [Moniliophthora roreri MCA 2997]|uniref:Phenylacetyl-ligase n=2 Tax=Moniliophthora roreri TaxID=221103 RepID=V2Z2B1_MONRO|nr:phenylacetyl- ligase [Moniliophthora roreri MCA 2997]KAI3622275.1 phenylacetyl-ligase [Moniliophthora roreri]
MSTQFCAPNNPSLPPIPDDLTIPQFMLDSIYPSSPHRPESIPWLLEDRSARPIHYKEIRHRTRALANGLYLKWNIRENDVVCILSPNDVDYPISIWAIHTLGAIVTPANPGYTVDELLHQLQTAKVQLLIVHSTFLQTAQAAAKQAGLSSDRIVVIPAPGVKVDTTTINDVAIFGSRRPESFQECRLGPGEAKTKRAFLSFSSGTTGKPKAVEIPHHSVIANVLQMAVHFQVLRDNKNETNEVMRPGGVVAAVLPFFHIYGLVVQMHFMLFCGLSLVVIPKFSFVEYLKSCQRHRITHLLCVPPQVVLMCKHPVMKNYDLSHVKFFMCGAAPLSGELVEQLQKICPNSVIGQGYGLTETCTTVSAFPPTQKIGTVGSAGQFVPGIKARVIKADGSLAREGEQGELVVTGPSMALGYLNNEQATKETFVNGWVHTGDEVIIKNGEIFVVDRLKEIIKVKGFQVAPAELEGHLLLHPAVSDACVVGIPDEYKGEVPLAYVVISDKLTSEMKSSPDKLKTEIMKHVSVNKVQYKWLAAVEFIHSIPKNPSGKILRRVLRDQARKERYPLQAKL